MNSSNFPSYVAGQQIKRVIAYKNKDIATCHSGLASSLAKATAYDVPVYDRLTLGYAPYFSASRLNGHIQSWGMYPKRLSDETIVGLRV